MHTIPPYLKKITEKYTAVKNKGFTATELERVRFFWADTSAPRAPLIYDAGLVIILQGHKIGYLDDHIFHYNTDNYLIISMAIPFECETIASPEEPLVGITIDIDLAELHELVALISDEKNFNAEYSPTNLPKGIGPAQMNNELQNTVRRLINCLCSPLECKIIGDSLIRELIYRILLDRNGASLYSLTQHNTYYTNIAKAIAYIRSNYTKPLIIDDLALYAGMSLSVFHRTFKEITGNSPLQYIKKIKLTQAKHFLMHENMTASMAANTVGYESPSQFSREFKRYFGMSPKKCR